MSRPMPRAVPRPVVVGICGGSGSGKTTLALKLAERLGPGNAVVLSQDAYYHDTSRASDEERAGINYDHPAALDWRLLEEHIRCLQEYRSVDIPAYDYTLHARVGAAPVTPARTIILEGHLIFCDEGVRSLMDIRLFIDAAADIMLLRRIRRDIDERGRTVQEVLDRYMATVRPMYAEYVAPGKQWADIVVPGGSPDHDSMANDVLAALRAKIEDIARGRSR